jgi:predicted lipase
MPIVFGNQALQGYVAVLEGTSLLIGFRGPQNPYDIMSYVEKNQPVSYPYCKDCFVHSGFFNAWSIIKNDFIKSLQKELTLFRDIKYIFIAGHGLGAVFSVLAVPEISIVFDRKILMFVDTFGQPPFGDQKFSSYLQNLLQEKNFFIIRSVHNADLIPHEPRLSQYTHIPKD